MDRTTSPKPSIIIMGSFNLLFLTNCVFRLNCLFALKEARGRCEYGFRAGMVATPKCFFY
eukprot:scaffold34937_cov165-Amphora_coffeaeformis.AAC.8